MNYEKDVSYSIVIAFKKGDKKIIHGVTNYSIDAENRYAKVEKNGYRQFFNFDEILYIGRKFDLEDSEND